MATYATYAEALDGYLAHADYAAAGDRARCEQFIVACRSLGVLRPTAAKQGETETQFSAETLRQEIDEANRWLAAHPADTTPRTRFASFANFRD